MSFNDVGDKNILEEENITAFPFNDLSINGNSSSVIIYTGESTE